MKPLDINFFSPTPPKVNTRKAVSTSHSRLRNSTTEAETIDGSPSVVTTKNQKESKTELTTDTNCIKDGAQEVNTNDSSTRPIRILQINDNDTDHSTEIVTADTVENLEKVEQKISMESNVFDNKAHAGNNNDSNNNNNNNNNNLKIVDGNETNNNPSNNITEKTEVTENDLHYIAGASGNDSKSDAVTNVFDKVNSIIENAKQKEAPSIVKVETISSSKPDNDIKSVESFDFFSTIDDNGEENDLFGKVTPARSNTTSIDKNYNINSANVATTNHDANSTEHKPQSISTASDLFSNLDIDTTADPVADFFQSVDAVQSSNIFDNRIPEANNNNERIHSNMSGNSGNMSNVNAQTPVIKATQNASPTANGWIECFDHNSGYPYWYNNETGESSWEKPVIPSQQVTQPLPVREQEAKQVAMVSMDREKTIQQQHNNFYKNISSSSRNAHLYTLRQQQAQLQKLQKQQQHASIKPKKIKEKRRSHLAHLGRLPFGGGSPTVNSPNTFSGSLMPSNSTPTTTQETGALAYNSTQNKHPLLQAFGSKPKRREPKKRRERRQPKQLKYGQTQAQNQEVQVQEHKQNQHNQFGGSNNNGVYNNTQQQYTNGTPTQQYNIANNNDNAQVSQGYYTKQQQAMQIDHLERIPANSDTIQQEQLIISQQSSSQELFVQTNLSPEKDETEHQHQTPHTGASTSTTEGDLKKQPVKKQDPLHADTPSLLAIREATASIFADLNSNLESIKNLDTKANSIKKDENGKSITANENTQNNTINTVIPSLPTSENMNEEIAVENVSVAHQNKNVNVPVPNFVAPVEKSNRVVETSQLPQITQHVLQPQQPVKQKKQAVRRGTNAHLLLKKTALQAAVPTTTNPQRKKQKKKAKPRNHLAHLAKVEAVFTDTNSPNVFDGTPPAKTAQHNGTAPEQLQRPAQPQKHQQHYDSQEYNNQQNYYDHKQQYYQQGQYDPTVQQQQLQYEYTNQQQQYVEQVNTVSPQVMNPSITTFQVKASPLKDNSRVQQDQTPVSTDVPVTQLVPGHPTVAELKAAEDKKILMEKKKMEKKKRAEERKKKAAEWKKKQAAKRKGVAIGSISTADGALNATISNVPPPSILTVNNANTSPPIPPTSGPPTTMPPVPAQSNSSKSHKKDTALPSVSRNKHLATIAASSAPPIPDSTNDVSYADHSFDPRSRGPVMSFGFGGRMLTTKAQMHGGSKTYRRRGNVKISSINSILTRNNIINKLNKFPGPLEADMTNQFKSQTIASSLQTFLSYRIKSAPQINESKESKLLWSILLSIISFDDIKKATLSNKRFAAEIIDKLKLYNDEVEKDRKMAQDTKIAATRSDEEKNLLPEDENTTGIDVVREEEVVDDKLDERIKETDKGEEIPEEEKEEGDQDGGEEGEEEKEKTEVEDDKQEENIEKEEENFEKEKDVIGEAPLEEKYDGDASTRKKENECYSEEQKGAKINQFVNENNFVEAVKYAKKCGLWGHAFILSQKISKCDYLNTIKEFTETLVGEESALKNLYLETSKLFCETNTIFTNWALDIIAIIEDQSTIVNFEKINKIGDRLFDSSIAIERDAESDSYCFAAHICYLLGKRNVQAISMPRARMVLLGANHPRRPYEYTTVDAIQRTEILEYIRTYQAGSKLGGVVKDFVSYQSHKLLYTTTLCDYGNLEAAKLYVELLKKKKLNEATKMELDMLYDLLITGNPIIYEEQPMQVVQQDVSRPNMTGPPLLQQEKPQIMTPSLPAEQKNPQVMLPQKPSAQHIQQFNPQQYQQAQQQTQEQQKQQYQNKQHQNKQSLQQHQPTPEQVAKEVKKEGGGWFSSMLVHAIHGSGGEDPEGGGNDEVNKQQQQQQQQQEQQQQQQQQQQQHYNTNKQQIQTQEQLTKPLQANEKKVEEKPQEVVKAPKESSTNGSSGGGGGITGWLRGAFMKKEDQDKVAKQGKGLEAYYDKDLKRWVFPDDPNSATPAPELTEPPTFGNDTTNKNFGSDNATNTNGLSSGALLDSNADNNNDPMSALMAPPSYRINNRKSVTSRYASVGFAVSEDDNSDKNNCPPSNMMMPPMPGNFGGATPKIMSFNKK